MDIALWDLFGKATGQPVYQLLGGLSRDRIRTYNTCAGYRYVRSRPDWGTVDWGLDGVAEGPWEDLDCLPPPGRRARAQPAGTGHHGNEDLAERPRGGGVRRLLHLAPGYRPGTGAVPQDSSCRRRPDGRDGGAAFAVGGTPRR